MIVKILPILLCGNFDGVFYPVKVSMSEKFKTDCLFSLIV